MTFTAYKPIMRYFCATASRDSVTFDLYGVSHAKRHHKS